MSKITNLIGTTWRLDSESVRGIPAEYGKFNVNANGSFSYLGEPVSVVTTSFNVGYIEQPTQSTPFTDAVSFYVVELNDGGTIEQNVGYMFVNTTQDTVYEFTITGGTDISNPLFIDFINTYGTLVSGGEPSVKIDVSYKGSVIATLEAGQTATLRCNGKNMVDDIIITVSE